MPRKAIYNKEQRKAYHAEWYKNNKQKHQDAVKLWRTNNPEKYYKQRRNQGLRVNYGITSEIYDKMYDEQAGKCAICKRHQNELNHKLHVDHNHTTKEVRALLCKKCNSALGALNEDINLMLKMIDYVKKHNSGFGSINEGAVELPQLTINN